MYRKASHKVFEFPFRFSSGAMRGRFNARDGQLYVTGLKGWQTSGAKDGCLQRVRYVGGDWPRPLALQAHENGIFLRFGVQLDEELATDPESFSIHHWNYRWTNKYGSPDCKVSNPNQTGRDKLKVVSSRLMEDGMSVFSGWMFASSPTLNSLEHPVYDVWVLRCTGSRT